MQRWTLILLVMLVGCGAPTEISIKLLELDKNLEFTRLVYQEALWGKKNNGVNYAAAFNPQDTEHTNSFHFSPYTGDSLYVYIRKGAVFELILSRNGKICGKYTLKYENGRVYDEIRNTGYAEFRVRCRE